MRQIEGRRRVTRRQPVDNSIRQRARDLWRDATRVEREVWGLLRGRRTLGLKFRRQQVVGGFIVDFYCAELGLALEMDGAGHDDVQQAQYDTERDQVLARLGVQILRVKNEMATPSLLNKILGSCLLVPPLPSGRGGQGVR